MPNVHFSLNTDEIAETFHLFRQEVEQELNEAARNLANQTYTFLLEMVQNELHSTRNTYLQALTPFKEIAPGVFVCTLEQSAIFIEDGLPENFDMKPGLLKNGKVGKNGIRYRIIPFEHNGPAQDRTVNMSNMREQLQKGYKEKFGKGASLFGKTTDGAGNLKHGRTIKDLDLGGPIPGRGNTPIGQNVNAFQRVTGQNKKGQRTGTLSVKTFRTVTSGPKSQGKWIHPGLQAKNFFERAKEHAMAIWESQVLPEALKNIESWTKWE
jgi:hypothetical protein